MPFSRKFTFLSVFFFALCIKNGNSLSPLEGNSSHICLPFSLYHFPSLITYQEDLSLGLHYDYINFYGFHELTGVFQRSYGKNAFGFGFSGLFPDSIKYISGGFSHRMGMFSLGSVLHLLLKNEASVTADVSVSFESKRNMYVSICGKNILITRDFQKEIFREIHFGLGGTVSGKYRINSNFDSFISFQNEINNDIVYSFSADINKSFFRSPSLNLLAGISYSSFTREENSFCVVGGIGFYLQTEKSKLGLFTQYKHDFLEYFSGMNINVLLQSKEIRDRTPPHVELTMSDTVFYPHGTQQPFRVIFSLNCTDNPGGTGITEWILAISKEKDVENLVRVFVGTGTPPSSIIWDGRDSEEKILKTGIYFTRIVCIDKNRNRGMSPWKKIEILE